MLSAFCPVGLNGHNVRIWWNNIPCSVVVCRRERRAFCTQSEHKVFRPVLPPHPKESAVVGDWYSVHGHVGGIPHANLMLEEEGPNNTVSQQDGAPRLYFHIAVPGSKVSTEMD